MLFNTEKYIDFGFSNRKFLSNEKFISHSSTSSVFINDEIAPTICDGVSKNKIIAVKKGFSESLDRRASLLLKSRNNNFTKTFNIFTNQVEEIPTEYTHYRSSNPFIDTTGTAVHSDKKAVYTRAVFELLQKNSLFVFWYGKKGFLMEENINKDYIEYTIIENSFYPVVTAINFKFYEDYLSCGLGTDLNVSAAKEAAEDENTLINNLILKSNNVYQNLDRHSYHEFSTYYDEYIYDYLKDMIKNLETYTIDEKKYSFKDFLQDKPNWLNNIQTFMVPVTLNRKLVCVKTYSPQLYMSLPRKEFLDLRKDINKFTINIKELELEKIPNIPQM